MAHYISYSLFDKLTLLLVDNRSNSRANTYRKSLAVMLRMYLLDINHILYNFLFQILLPITFCNVLK